MMKLMFAFLIIIGGVIFPQEENKVISTEEEEFVPYEGQFIRKINFRILDVSGPDVEDQNGEDTSWFSKIANSLHYKTREWVVRNYLLFREGDQVNAYDLSESERILRESDFFLDSRVQVIPLEQSDSIDVVVTTKDRWTLIFQLSLDSETNSYAGVRDDNFAGLGHELDGTVTNDSDPIIGWGYKMKYTAHNIAGSFIDASAGIETNKKSSVKRIDLARSFVSLKTRWAGGFNVQWADNHLLYKINDVFNLTPYSNNSIDIWTGYSFPVIFGSPQFRKRTNFTTAARINRSHFSSRPYTTADSNKVFANSIIYLFSTGIINRRFYRDHYINRFGPTEDVPIGGIFTVTGGYDINEFSRRNYLGFEGILSRRINNFGYLSLHTGAGGFFNNNRWEQNTYLFDILYHSRLIGLDGWKMRMFVQNSYLIGTNRYDQEQIYLDTENGLRGFERFSLHGVSRGLLKLEARVFTPFEPLGFAIGASLFTDLGIVAEKGQQLFNSRIYQSYGGGLKISNESISRAHFDVALVFRPYTPLKPNGSFALLFTSSMVLGSRPFNFSKPAMLDYGEN